MGFNGSYICHILNWKEFIISDIKTYYLTQKEILQYDADLEVRLRYERATRLEKERDYYLANLDAEAVKYIDQR